MILERIVYHCKVVFRVILLLFFRALINTRNKRPFVISRSTYSGQGYYGGHWSGDNFATYYDMAMSIPGKIYIKKKKRLMLKLEPNT